MKATICLLLFLGLASCAASQTLLKEDFEAGLPGGWEIASGNWTVVSDPDVAGNHVLQALGQGTIDFGEPTWDHYRVTARIKVAASEARGFHVKLGVRAAARDRVYWLNLRDGGPALIRHVGTEFAQLAAVGGFNVTPGVWYECSLECAGPVLHAKVENRDRRWEYGEARVLDDRIAAGRLQFTLVTYDGPVTVWFDDVEVIKAPAATTPAGGPKHTVASRLSRVALDESTGELKLTDLRTGKTWGQSTYGVVLPRVSDVRADAKARTLSFTLDAAAGKIGVAVRLEGSEVLVDLEPAAPGRAVSLDYPLPQLPAPDQELVLPADEGIIVPASRVDLPRLVGAYQYGQGGVLMPWFGIVDGGQGLMALIETSDDFRLQVRQARSGETVVPAPAVEWLPSRDDLRYRRRVRFCLFDGGAPDPYGTRRPASDRGGYVAMAKRYRRWLQDQGRFRTIADKAREIPAVERLVGAVNVYDRSPDTTLFDWMIENDITRCLYSCGGPRERIEKAQRAGYVVSRYDIYTDIAGPELLAHWGPPRSELDHRRIGYPDECIISRSGDPLPGFAYPVGAREGVDPSGAAGKRVRCYKRCSRSKLAWLKKNIPPQIEELGYDARFIDVETATGFHECYSDEHPVTRTQDREAKLGLFNYLRSLGQVCSSEGGGDWAAHALHYQEGSLTITRMGGIPGVYVGTKPFRLPEEYIRLQLDPSIRAPLHELVYHDSMWMTWRWNHTPNRWEQREYWDDWDLLHILYGAMPIYVVHKNYLDEQGPRLLQSMRNIGGILQKVGDREMLSHRFLTADRLVQETRFAGAVGVVGNFGTTPYRLPSGETVPPKSHRELQLGE